MWAKQPKSFEGKKSVTLWSCVILGSDQRQKLFWLSSLSLAACYAGRSVLISEGRFVWKSHKFHHFTQLEANCFHCPSTCKCMMLPLFYSGATCSEVSPCFVAQQTFTKAQRHKQKKRFRIAIWSFLLNFATEKQINVDIHISHEKY